MNAQPPSPAPEASPGPRPFAPARATWIFIAAVLVLGVGLFHQVWQFGFIDMDDVPYILESPWVQKGLTAESVRWAFEANLVYYSKFTEYWQPLTLLSRLLDYELFGMSPGAFHLVSASLHLLNTLLLGFTLARLTGARLPSYLVAVLFLVHPQNVEAACFLSARKDQVNTLCFFVLLLVYHWYTRRPSLGRYGAVLGAMLLAMMAKPMAAAFPLLLLVLDFWPLRRWPQQAPAVPPPTHPVLEKLPLLLLGAAIASLSAFIQAEQGSLWSADKVRFPFRIANAITNYATYLRRLVWPSDLAAVYPNPMENVSMVYVAICAAGLLAVAALVAWRGRKNPAIIAGALWYVVMLIPVAGLSPSGHVMSADRFSYLPTIGAFIALVWASVAGWKSRTAVVVWSVLIALLLPVTATQIRTWRSSETLWLNAIHQQPGHHYPHLLLARSYVKTPAKYETALQHLDISDQLTDPRKSLKTRWILASNRQEWRKALEYQEQYLRDEPNHGETLEYAADAARELKDYPKSLEYARRLAQQPRYQQKGMLMEGYLLVLMQRFSEAALVWDKYLALYPDDPRAQQFREITQKALRRAQPTAP